MATIAEIFETMEYGPAPESADPAQAWLDARSTARFGRSSTAHVSAGRAASTSTPSTRPTRKPLARVAQCGAARTWTRRWRRRARRSPAGGAGRPRPRPLPLRARARRSRSTRACSPCWRRWTTASRSARRATSTSRSSPATSTITPAGRSSWRRELPGYAPVGVVGQIIPWNFPLLMLAWKIAPALAAGQHGRPQARRVHVADRARCSPRSAARPACRRAWSTSSPATADTGELIVDHPGIDKIAFTGSTEVGRIIREATAGTGKKLSLELGGKSPFIVFDDADLDGAVEGVVDAIWFNQGQVCCAGSRLLVQEGVAEPLLRQAARAAWRPCASAIRCDKAIDIGAIVAPVQLERIARLVEPGRSKRARRCWQPSWSCPREGCFYPPTLFTDVAPAGDHRAGRDLRPGAGRHDLPHAGRGRRAGEQHPLRPGRQRLDARTSTSRSTSRREDQGRHGAGSTAPTCSTPPPASAATARAASAARAARRGCGSTCSRAGRPRRRSRKQEADAAKSDGRSPRADGRQGRAVPIWRPAAPSTARPSSTSAASRPARTAATAARSTGPAGTARRGGRGQPQGHPQRRRGRAQGRARLGEVDRPHLRAQILYYIAENLAARADEFADRLARHDRRRGRRRPREVDARDRAPLRLRRLGRQVRRRRPRTRRCATSPSPMHEPIGVDRHRLPRRARRCSPSSPRGPGDRHGQHRRRRPLRALPAGAPPTSTRSSTPRTCRPASSTSSPAPATPWPVLAEHDDVDAVWYFGSRGGQRRRRARLDRQPQAHLGRLRPAARLGRPRAGRGRGVPAPGHPGQEHLGAVRGVGSRPAVFPSPPPPRPPPAVRRPWPPEARGSRGGRRRDRCRGCAGPAGRRGPATCAGRARGMR